MPVDVDGATIICGHHELYGRVLRNGDESCVMHHKEIPAARLERFPVEVPVDVVFYL